MISLKDLMHKLGRGGCEIEGDEDRADEDEDEDEVYS